MSQYADVVSTIDFKSGPFLYESNCDHTIRLQGVWSSYQRGAYVLRNFDLNVKNGSSHIIIGPSGSGKSTLLKLAIGLVRADRGRVEVFGRELDHRGDRLKELRSRIGYIPQNLGLVKNLTAIENVLMGALPRLGYQSILKIFPKDELEFAMETLALVGLEDKAQKKTYSLSGGEGQRVAVARALVQRPVLLIADELVSDLDFVKAREVMDVMAEAKRRLGITMVMVHHDLELVKAYADLVTIVKDGTKVADVEPERLDKEALRTLFKMGNGH